MLIASLCLTTVLTGCDSDDDDDEVAVASFTWEMTSRTRSVINTEFKPEVDVEHRMIESPVPGQPGLYDGISSVPLDQVNPQNGYEVNLDACASTGVNTYAWTINGEEVSQSGSCTLTTQLPEGSHEITLNVSGDNTDTATETIEVKDYLIVVMGDSYTSGEGNATRYEADVPDSSLAEDTANNGAGWSEGGYWDHANCHRSTRSGQANAIIDLENSDPHSSVTTIFVACSGAQIDNGILGIKDGYLGGAEDSQARQAYDLTIARGRNIDAIILGIGGNDIGFVPLVAECALQDDCFFSTEKLVNLTTPPLPVTDQDTAVDPDDLANLTLKPDATFPALPTGNWKSPACTAAMPNFWKHLPVMVVLGQKTTAGNHLAPPLQVWNRLHSA